MGGFKNSWVALFTLFIIAACVPQTKQTECKGNEAFNASLRQCVPVIQGPSAFINISSYSPLFTVSRYKNDAITPVTLTISVSNPYNQTYSIAWERVYNGAPVTVGSNSPTYSFYPSSLSTQVGTHIFTAKILSSAGVVVDSHSFQVIISDLPKPSIATSTITPAPYALDKYPSDAATQFSFRVNNNGATLTTLETIWYVTRNGGAIYSETDVLNTGANDNTMTYLGVVGVPWFDPGALGVGSYIVRAVVLANAEIVDERQWNVIVKQPPLTNVSTISAPAPGVTITAHNNVAYNAFPGPPALSWIYGGAATQPNFCVTIDDRDGTYPGDGMSVLVKFYLNSTGGDICTKKTLDTAGSQQICLVDANNCDPDGANVPFDTSILMFTNSSPTVSQNHKVTARVFDEATGIELDRANVLPSNGSYPIEWLVLNRPINTAPIVGFGATIPTGCTSGGAFTRNNCAVTQGTPFTVGFTVSDDFYTAAANPEEFMWTVTLKYNGTDVTGASCTKAFGAALPAYVNEWTCTLTVPHFISTGPLDPSTGTYAVVATVQDSGSPVGGTNLSSTPITWNLAVTEANSGITLEPQTALLADSHISLAGTPLDPANPADYATERETVTFTLNVTDPELDNFRYRVSLCTIGGAACTSSSVLTSPAYIDFIRSIQGTPTTNPVLVNALLYTLPEDLLLQVGLDVGTAAGDAALVHFKVDVEDVPSVPLTTVGVSSEIFAIYVRNYNPYPVINTATANPAVGSTTVVYSGYQFTIDPGTVTDTGPASETSIVYQWYADIGGGFAAIDGATSRILRYTPGNENTNITLKLCVGDRPAANPIDPAGPNCSATWTVSPRRYLEDLTAPGITTLQNEVAVWYDNTNVIPNTEVIYSAYVDDSETIFVEKTIKNAAGDIVLSTNTVSFPALAAGVASAVTNLSISGSSDSVYIAYLASSTVAPSTMIPRIRRIDKRYAATGGKVGLDHLAPFGFNYTHYTLSDGGTPCSVCTYLPGDGIGGPATITFSAAIPAGEQFNINGIEFTAAAAPAAGAQEVCDNGSCPGPNSTATNVAAKINNSTLALLHGISAVASGADVVLHNQYHDDYLDISTVVALANGMGKIFVAGGRWHLPVINSSLGGAQQNNITVLSGLSDVHLRDPLVSLSTDDTLTSMGKVASFDAKLNAAGELVVAKISGELVDSGALSLHRFTLTGSDWDATGGVIAPAQQSMNILSSYSFEYVKLATNKAGNNHYYVIAKEKTINGGEYHIGRYNFELNPAGTTENFLLNRLVTTDSTDDVIDDTKMVNPDLESVPGFSEARIFFHSVGLGATPYPRLARWLSDNTVKCGTCNSLTDGLPYQSTARIGLSQVASSITLGAAGGTVGENTNSVVFALFSSDIAINGIFLPQLGIINIESESIQSTTVDATGRWRPPFVLD